MKVNCMWDVGLIESPQNEKKLELLDTKAKVELCQIFLDMRDTL